MLKSRDPYAVANLSKTTLFQNHDGQDRGFISGYIEFRVSANDLNNEETWKCVYLVSYTAQIILTGS